jgi:hypothetical protein
VSVGASGVTLTLVGEHFIGGASTGRIGGLAQDSKVASGEKMTVTVPAALLASAGELTVTVFTPPPGGGESQAISVPVVP